MVVAVFMFMFVFMPMPMPMPVPVLMPMVAESLTKRTLICHIHERGVAWQVVASLPLASFKMLMSHAIYPETPARVEPLIST